MMEENKNTQIGIVIPVFNVAPYLEECLQSVIHQTYSDIEIIIIDDGSTDGSGVICDNYAARDHRITVFHEINEGLSVARNKGVERSKSPYILFVDSDDVLAANACKDLYDIVAQQSVDIISFRTCTFHSKIEAATMARGTRQTAFFSRTEAGICYLYGRYFMHSAWSKLYKRHILERIPFPKGKLAEDFAVSYLHIQEAEKLAYFDETLYFYRVRPNSIMTSSRLKLVMDIYDTTCVKRDFELEHFPDHRKRVETMYANCLLKTLARLHKEKPNAYREQSAEIEQRLAVIDRSDLSRTTRAIYSLYCLNKTLFVWVMSAIRKIA